MSEMYQFYATYPLAMAGVRPLLLVPCNPVIPVAWYVCLPVIPFEAKARGVNLDLKSGVGVPKAVSRLHGSYFANSCEATGPKL